MLARTRTCWPFCGRKVTRRLLLRNIAQRTWARSSFSVKYQWPEAGWERLEIRRRANLPHFHFQQLANRLIEAAYGKMEGETGSDM